MKQTFIIDHLRTLIISMITCLFFISMACNSPDDSKNATKSEQDHSQHEAEDHSMHGHDGEISGEQSQIYTCSMHPQVRNEAPGRCPICGMDLIPVADETSVEDSTETEVENGDQIGINGKIQISTNSPTSSNLKEVTHNHTPASNSLNSGAMLSRAFASQSSIVLAEVTWSDALIEQTVPGKVMVSKDGIRVQTAHVSGRIEELYVREDGEFIQAGEPIASIYSPELISAQKELLEAYKQRIESPDLYEAAKTRLKNWEITDAQIHDIVQSDKVLNQIDVMADYSGYLDQKRVEVGEYVNPGSALLKIIDLSTVLISLDASALQSPWIQLGDRVKIDSDLSIDAKNHVLDGIVEFISPVVHPTRQTTEIRTEVDNTYKSLRPGMLVEARITSQFSEEPVRVIPSSSVLWTGESSLVYAAHEMNNSWHFTLKRVSIGPRFGDQVTVLSGLEIGELIVKNGAFKIDAVSQLSGNMSMMSSNGTDGHLSHH